MKKMLGIVLFIFAIGLYGCGESIDVANSAQAVRKAREMGGKRHQIAFLLEQAEEFHRIRFYDEAVDTGEYIIDHLDPYNIEARKIIKKAQKAQGASRQAGGF